MCKRNNSHFVHYVLMAPEAESCAGHNPGTVQDKLIIFGWDMYQVK